MFTAWTGKKFVGAWTDKEKALRYAASHNARLFEVDFSAALDDEVQAMAEQILREKAEQYERNKDKPKVHLFSIDAEAGSGGKLN